MYEFRESDDGELYLSTIEPFVWVNHSGTFITRTEIPFGENGNGYRFDVLLDQGKIKLDLMLSRPSGHGETFSFKMDKKWRPLLFPESETFIINSVA